jgi:hypothetical protein
MVNDSFGGTEYLTYYVPSATMPWTKPCAETLDTAARRPTRAEVVIIEGIFEAKGK